MEKLIPQIGDFSLGETDESTEKGQSFLCSRTRRACLPSFLLVGGATA
jgi:hypothetical protein